LKKRVFTLTNAILVEPSDDYQGLGSITIEDGIIVSINGSLRGKEINCNGAFLAPGIIDMGVKICEPGERHKESFRSAGASAAAGGVTTIVTRPDTNPPIDTPEMLEFFIRRANAATKTKILPMAALTKNLACKEITEMAFLHDRGAIAFSNGLTQVSNAKVFLNALKYASDLNLLIVGHPQDLMLSRNSSATSGNFAIIRGIPGVSTVAEKLGIDRDIELVEHANVRYHADQITTERSLESIKNAKLRGLRITAGTSIHHLTLNEFDIANYRTFFKLSPPLRSENDRLSMIQGLIDDEIDTISSFHSPQDEESKRLPFEIAASGAVGLETLLPACLQLVHNGYLSIPKLFKFLSANPAKILNIPGGHLAVNQPGDLILFDKNIPFVMDRFKLLSKSKNTPFDERTMQGKVLATLINGEVAYRDKESLIDI
jgi:dihydroorotase